MVSYGVRRAINEIRHILESQWKNGMLPQIRFLDGQEGYSPDSQEWGVTREISGADMDTSGITQPPNVGISLWKVYEKSHEPEVIEFLKEAYPKIKAYHEFLLRERDPEGEYLAAVFHPWATGTDNAPCYDELIEDTRLKLQGYEQRIRKRKDINKVIAAYRPGERDYECYGRLIGFFVDKGFDQKAIYEECPFVVKDVLFNCILKESVSCLAKIAEVLVKDDPYFEQEKEYNLKLAEDIASAIRTKLYDEETGLFYNYDVRNDRLLKVPTIHSSSPLFGKVADEKQAERLIGHLKTTFKAEVMVPTTAPSAESFENVRYWRGPVWPVTNWIILEGLRHYDEGMYEELKKDTISMICEGYPPDEKLAASLMEYTSYGEEFTTPSKSQYCHGWLWDSGFAAIGWRHVEKKVDPSIWEKVAKRKDQIALAKSRTVIKDEFDMPFYDEYYAPRTEGVYKAGQPLGAEMMTWTAALLLDFIHA